MVLISITSDPNDFLTAPHPVLYNTSRGSSTGNNGSKPVHNSNWSNGAGNTGATVDSGQAETTSGHDTNVNVNQPAAGPDLVLVRLEIMIVLSDQAQLFFPVVSRLDKAKLHKLGIIALKTSRGVHFLDLGYFTF